MLIEELLSCQAVRFGDFTLTSGKKSRYYVDIKRASCNPDILSKITDLFSYEAVECDKVAGVELGAVPLVVAYSLRNKVPLLIIRKKGNPLPSHPFRTSFTHLYITILFLVPQDL